MSADKNAGVSNTLWESAYQSYPEIYDLFAKRQDPENNVLGLVCRFETIKDLTILDVGSGTGRYSNPLARGGATVIAMEPSQPLVNVHEQNLAHDPEVRKRTSFLNAGAEAIPLPDGHCDVALVVHSLSAIYDPIPQREGEPDAAWIIRTLAYRKAALLEICRVVKPNG